MRWRTTLAHRSASIWYKIQKNAYGLFSCNEMTICKEPLHRRVRRTLANSRLMWFGEQHATHAHSDCKDAMRCHIAPSLQVFSSLCSSSNCSPSQDYHSIGARLLRVPTFHMAYLNRMRFAPVVTYYSPAGAFTLALIIISHLSVCFLDSLHSVELTSVHYSHLSPCSAHIHTDDAC